ncbi:MAG: phosphatidylserine decarboxylase [Candidatus Fusobacterium pullicola]|uniref:Phosphatidylserine decarboxylase proenzyme n=1 Tax=Candidatus Fusobacterium pullicola TaxID=2838601 RepID=A0A9E2KVY0_9FUSO|nr:phosphatidylserine decarboxylase [uncultured Fusobacterium sp.]MBU3841427.1 phosphatidylserine decarboxylase [Candidatus Fusobacterium pullicola]
MEFKKIEYIERKTGEIKVEKVPGEKYLKFLYYNPLGELPLNLVVKKKFLTEYYGKKMDKPESVKKIPSFIEQADINIAEAKKRVEEFKSFNDFFYRELKEGARTVDYRENVLASPADGKILAFENLDREKEFYIKGDKFTLEEFFADKKLANKYKNGVFMIIRLAPIDYHRFHFPADGEISESKLIDGVYYSVSTYAIKKNFRILCENKREYSILKTEKFGDIAMFEVGATMVGGIKQSYKSNSYVKKGEEKGYFYFGGSTCVLVFERGKVKIDEDLLENTKKGIETKVYMGEKIGISLN